MEEVNLWLIFQRSSLPRHALEKFDSLKHYGFQISESQVADAVLNPERIERRGNQFFAVKLINSKHALRVVYEKRKGFLVVITFYPVRRERYDL
ncbi:MAG: DUF4258 domain-containing protein [Candidatus Bathyarchaeia archaeon]